MSVYHTFNTVKFININVTVDCFCHLELVFLFCGSSECQIYFSSISLCILSFLSQLCCLIMKWKQIIQRCHIFYLCLQMQRNANKFILIVFPQSFRPFTHLQRMTHVVPVRALRPSSLQRSLTDWTPFQGLKWTFGLLE